jgi:hypothetical protein
MVGGRRRAGTVTSFFAATSFITSISRSRSATSFFSRAFSPSSCFSRLTSSAWKPPNRLRHVWIVCFADPVTLGHRRHRFAIRLADDRHHLSVRKTRFAHRSLRIGSQSLT